VAAIGRVGVDRPQAGVRPQEGDLGVAGELAGDRERGEIHLVARAEARDARAICTLGGGRCAGGRTAP